MSLSRRDLLALLPALSVAAVPAAKALAAGEEPEYRGRLRLEGSPRKTRVVVVGAGLAGLTTAFELSNAGYEVQVLEYNTRSGGRSWTLRGGDRYTELGGAAQRCEFAPGVYMNPGPWRVSHTHRAFLDYCKRFGVAVEPFLQLNTNGYIHARGVLGGKPQRYRHVIPDFQGHVAEMLSERLSGAEATRLKSLLAAWGGLDGAGRYTTGPSSMRMRGPQTFDVEQGLEIPAPPLSLEEVMELCEATAVLRGPTNVGLSEFQMPLFQPVGGMDMLAKAFTQRVQHLIRYNAKVVSIAQDAAKAIVTYEDARAPGQHHRVEADWCVCTLPLTILSQIELQVAEPKRAAIGAIPYGSEVKIGLQFKRRFWEEDDAIYGGFSVTDLPIRQIVYPSGALNSPGPGMLYGAMIHRGPLAFEFTGMSPQERIRKALEYGAQIHPQYSAEFENGMAVAWYRNPYTLGCTSQWTEELVRAHYRDLRELDGRIALAGEAVSAKGWQDGAIMSALDVVRRLHAQVMRQDRA